MKCNICGNNKFKTGPNNRKSRNDTLPQCTNCHSLERHRILRSFYNLAIKKYDFKNWSILQISEDKVLDPGHFKNIEVSIYGEKNSIDIQKIERPTGKYDLVVCNHVIEHVENDKAAIKELFRVTSSKGFLQISVPDPLNKLATRDWGFPDHKQHGHYRVYGRDFIDLLISSLKGLSQAPVYIAEIVLIDEVTGVKDLAYIVTSEVLYMDFILKTYKEVTIRKV